VTIEVACDCGRTFKVRDELAGRTGRCPDCDARIRIPEIECRADCFCGKRLTFSVQQLGQTVNCESCGRAVMLTDPRFTPDIEIEQEAADDWPRCPACGTRVRQGDLLTCPECGASLRTGHINYRRSMPRAHRVMRPRTGPPVAKLREASAAPTRPPAPAAMPRFDTSHVAWKDTPQAQLAEGFVEEQGALGEALDFSPGSLSVLDHVLAQARRREDGILAGFLDEVAAYLGEVVTRNLGGAWRRTKDGRTVVAQLPGGKSFDPGSLVRKHLKEKGSFPQTFIALARSLQLA
jgi:DNA-directed RNA polymerase subunit RPC12/RpoP